MSPDLRAAGDAPRWSIVAVAVQLAILTIVFRRYSLVTYEFYQLLILSTVGFVIHAVLPLRFRLRFFLVLSVAGFALVAGPLATAYVCSAAIVFLMVARAPVAWGYRVAGALLIGVTLIVLRRGSTAAVWPLLGSVFMFRLVLYLYERRHQKQPAPLTGDAAYFLLLPNVCFPLFPVVDYKTFHRSHYERPADETYQAGIHWLIIGVLQLIVYRFVLTYWNIEPNAIGSTFDRVRAISSGWLLYVQVSGQFHIAVGLLHLFGFNLPATHKGFYLAHGFTDMWRRVNVYWTSFMQRLIYMPVALRLKNRDPRVVVVVATLAVFAATLVLHSYQTFWLRGQFTITLNDALFWTILWFLVCVTSLRELAKGRERKLGSKARPDLTTRLKHAAGIVATFVAMTILWSLWKAESWAAWLELWGVDVAP